MQAMPPLNGRMFRAFYEHMKAEKGWSRSVLERHTGIPHSSVANYMTGAYAERVIQREIDFCLAGAMDGLRPLESELYTDMIPWLSVYSQALQARLKPWSWRLGVMEGWIQEAPQDEERPAPQRDEGRAFVAWPKVGSPLRRTG